MNKKEAEDFIYRSYLKAEKYRDYNENDSSKRHPELTKEIIRNKSNTPCVAVTGSKGKGSVANMISQIMQTQKKVGLMTSPHLIDFCERFKVNGENITEEEFIKNVEAIYDEINEIELQLPKSVCISPMGIQANLALSYFNSSGTEFNIFECGKGARYDDVNNILHQYSVINSIFLEHTREIGDTVEKIAMDKSYVITGEQKCVYVAEQADSVMNIIIQRCKEKNVPVKIYNKDFRAENIKFTNDGMLFDVVTGNESYTDISIPLMGEHQAKNCALALALCKDVLKEFDIGSVKKNLSKLNWPGRMEIVCKNPLIILDACINRKSCNNIIQVLKSMHINKVTLVIGIPDDKDYLGVAAELSSMADKIILTKSQNPHYVFSEKQVEVLTGNGIKSMWTNSVSDAVNEAKRNQLPIVIVGTTSVVSEVKSEF